MNDRNRSRDDRDEPRRSTRDSSDRDEPRRSSRDSGRDEPRRDESRRDEPRGRDRDDRDEGRGRASVRDDPPRRSSRDEVPSRRTAVSSVVESRGGRGSTYRERTPETLKKRASMGNNDFDKIFRSDITVFSPNDGDNAVRFMQPTWPEAEHFGLDIFVHYGVGPDRQSYLCLKRMKNEACPICEEYDRAKRNGDDEYAKEIAARRRVAVYVIDRDHEKEGPQAWAMPQSVDQDLAKVGVDKRSGKVLPVDHPDHGYDFFFTKEGVKKNTKYKGLAFDRDPSDMGKDEWLDFVEQNPIPDILEYQTYEHIARVFGSGSPAPEEDDRDRGRDNDRSSRGRGRDDAPPERSDRGRGDDTDRGRSDRGRSREPERNADDPTWEEVHALSSSELDALCDRECRSLDPTTFDSDEALADAICADMGIPKPREAAPEGRRRSLSSVRAD